MKRGFRTSVRISRKGNCWDNAVAAIIFECIEIG